MRGAFKVQLHSGANRAFVPRAILQLPTTSSDQESAVARLAPSYTYHTWY
jgi:hypothetical protein